MKKHTYFEKIVIDLTSHWHQHTETYQQEHFKMSFLGDFTVDDHWYSFESPMFNCVNPNEVCPRDYQLAADCQLQATDFDNQANPINEQQQHQQQSNFQSKAAIKNEMLSINILEHDHLLCPNIFQEAQTHVSGSISKVIGEKQKARLPLQEQLIRRKELVSERHRRLKSHFDNQPLPKLQPIMNRTGRKLSGRERQMELERQEAYQLQLRDKYMSLIDQLQQKCEKLRELLGNIVAASPIYNDEMMQYLEENGLLVEQEEQYSQIPASL